MWKAYSQMKRKEVTNHPTKDIKLKNYGSLYKQRTGIVFKGEECY